MVNESMTRDTRLCNVEKILFSINGVARLNNYIKRIKQPYSYTNTQK